MASQPLNSLTSPPPPSEEDASDVCKKRTFLSMDVEEALTPALKKMRIDEDGDDERINAEDSDDDEEEEDEEEE